MNAPLRLDQFERLPVAWTTTIADGLSAALDTVADGGPESHRFLRFQWFAAALEHYGGAAQTLVVSSEAGPGIALPVVMAAWLGMLGVAMLPGCFWPFRSFPAATRDPLAWDVLVAALGRRVNALRVGPIYDNDHALGALLSAARRNGWRTLPRRIGESYALDIAGQRAQGPWPRNSTLRKNRFHEKHLGEHGALSWDFVARWDDRAFADLASIERASWIASRTDGADAKFTDEGHGRFWRSAVRDPVLADCFHAAVLRVDGRPAAFSFDIDAGATKYAIANSYDPAFAKHSPGKLLYYRNLVEGAERGIETVDWGLGDTGYKRTIGAAEGPIVRDWLLLKPGLPAAMGGVLGRLWARSGAPEHG